jgi:hypothetical protein
MGEERGWLGFPTLRPMPPFDLVECAQALDTLLRCHTPRATSDSSGRTKNRKQPSTTRKDRHQLKFGVPVSGVSQRRH